MGSVAADRGWCCAPPSLAASGEGRLFGEADEGGHLAHRHVGGGQVATGDVPAHVVEDCREGGALRGEAALQGARVGGQKSCDSTDLGGGGTEQLLDRSSNLR